MTYVNKVVGRYAVRNYVRKFWEIYGFSPTQREIAAALGFKSQSTVSEHLARLAKEGEVDLLRGVHRRIIMSQKKTVCPKCHHEFEGHP